MQIEMQFYCALARFYYCCKSKKKEPCINIGINAFCLELIANIRQPTNDYIKNNGLWNEYFNV